ncbi:P-loop containing nucleoside triphosphate hydrolase protein [Mycena vitilis]|nr:P-loop containing nucleoside triphosphate hydrolase protein [Mycena vitilis]
MHAKLRLDVPEASDRANELGLTAHAMWNHFQFLTRTVERAFRLGSQLYFTVRQPNGATTLTLLSLASPFFSILAVSVPWKHGFVVYASNLHYLRLRALSLLVSPTYRSDVRSNNLRNWILQEYNKAQAALGAVSDVDPQTQWMSKASPLTDMLLQLSGDLPVCYWLARAVLDPHGLSLVSFAILHQHSTSVHHTVCGLFYEISRVGDSLTAIRDWYQMADTRTEVVDGEYTSYDSSPNTAGMELEFRDVSFSYPDSRSKDPAIRNVSLKIAAGSLAVVVGANGSGKSTIIKLLNRLYDADSGDILVDGVPITRYRPAELRQSQVLLSQDLQLYPLTLAENIGLGDPEAADDVSRVIDAAEAGGASGLISKLADGMATMFSPVLTAHGSQLGNNKELREILKKLERGSVLSGGEKQRVIAARAFMRLLCGKIRLVLADEPSSALDPKGELRLFQQLNVCGDGKTMVLVTHRFAHLTKHADVIICMKSGQVVEVGTHKELMAQGGEYCELYRVQAGAFSDESA